MFIIYVCYIIQLVQTFITNYNTANASENIKISYHLIELLHHTWLQCKYKPLLLDSLFNSRAVGKVQYIDSNRYIYIARYSVSRSMGCN